MKLDKFDEKVCIERVYIHLDNVEEELAKNPSWLSYYSRQTALWQCQADDYKMRMKTRRGELAKELKESNPKITAVAIEAELDTDSEFLKLHKEYLKIKEQADLYTFTHTDLEKKQFSLQSINSRNKREESFSKSISYQTDDDESFDDKMARILDAQR
jgi:hypothetical protein